MGKNKVLIGRKDIADFKKLDLEGIEVKIDSGAYTSSLHCHEIESFKKEGKTWVKCKFLDPDHEQYNEKEYCFEVYKLRKVKSSNGIFEERYSIITEIKLFKKEYKIELTLTERGEMKFPVLLGRKFLSSKFVIDTSKKYLSQKNELIKIQITK